MSVLFRKPIPGDIGWVIAMHGEVYTQEFRFDPRFEVDIARKLISFLDQSNEFNLFLIPLVNGHRAGSVAVSMESDTTAFINFVLVLSEFRGQGVATSMLGAVIQHARLHHFSRLRLETYSCLKDAKKLYQKLGFCLTQTNSRVEKYGQQFDQEFWELAL